MEGGIRVEGAVRATLKMKSRERMMVSRAQAGRNKRRHRRVGRRKDPRNMEYNAAFAPRYFVLEGDRYRGRYIVCLVKKDACGIRTGQTRPDPQLYVPQREIN